MMDPNNGNSGHSAPPDLEQDLERDLGAIRSVWPQMEQQEPPELVDLAVLNTARRELARRRRPLRWLGAFATASVIVLTLTIVIQQDPNRPVPESEPEGLKLERATKGESRKRADDAPALSAPPAAAAPAASRAPTESSAPAAPSVMKMETAEEESDISDRDREPESMNLSEAQREMDSNFAKEPEEAGAAPELESKLRETSLLPAEEWIERLLQLRASGQEAQFKEELAAFQEAYPEYLLPTELTE